MTLAITFSAIALACYIALGVVTVRQSVRNRINRAFALYLAAMAFWQFTALMVSLSKSAASAILWYRFMTTGLAGQFIFHLFFILVFLGLEKQRSWFYAGWLIFVALLGTSGTNLIIESVSKSGATGLYVPHFGFLVPAVGIVAYAFLGYGIYALMQRYRKTRSGLQRNRIRYLLLGASAIAVGLLSNLTPVLQAYPIDVAASVVNAFLIAYAILRYQLLDITFVVRKGLLYFIPTAIIGIGYFLLISLIIGLFHAFAGPQILLVSLLVAVIAAAVAQPLRDKVQFWVDRLFFREKYDSSLMLQRLSRTAASVLDLDRLTEMILDEVATTIHVERAAFFVRHDESGELRPLAQRGLDDSADLMLRKDHPVVTWLSSHERALTKHDMEIMPQFKALWGQEREGLERMGAELFIPLKAKGELVGILAVGPKLSGVAYSQDDQLTLTTLANQVAVAIENARLYASLQAANRELEAALQAKDEMIQNVSHELRTPLTAILGYMELLEEANLGPVTTEQAQALEVMSRQAKRLYFMVNRLLTLQTINTKSLQKIEVESELLLHQAVEAWQGRAVAAGIRLDLDVSPDMPMVEVDVNLMNQVLDNLLDNAVKFSPNGGVVRVRAWAERSATPPECQVLISIADSGIGIAPDKLEHVFERFYQADGSMTRRFGGVGIGLALCQKIVAAHGGRIWVESKGAGQGSTFYVALPGIASEPTITRDTLQVKI